MIQSNVSEEYTRALRLGQKEYRERTAAGLPGGPIVLDERLPDAAGCTVQDVGVVEIPIERIVGTRSAGRVSAFSAGFYPLLDIDSEFAAKWMRLCQAHLSDTGIRDPIECCEYLGDFYVKEGNKRVSVLKSFGAARISAHVERLLPTETDTPRSRAYAEFLQFYKDSRIYDLQFQKPGSYARLLSALGKEPGELWTEDERRSFTARLHYFHEAFSALGGQKKSLSVEEALLLWLQVHPYRELGELSAKELKASLAALWEDVQTASAETPAVNTAPTAEKKTILDRLLTGAPRHLNTAFIYIRDPETSLWTRGHALGAAHMNQALGETVSVREYCHADTPEAVDALMDKAVEDGAELVFTTAPPLLRATLRAAVRYPKVRFLNCSTGTQLSSVRSYYCRAFEGKFITGMIAGAMAENDTIGYVGSYPILGVPAAINAFALGAQMTNPRARVLLEWSCLPGDAAATLRERGARVISNRDIPLNDPRYMDRGEFGTCLWEASGECVPLASPCWMWGELYEAIARTVLSGSWTQKKEEPQAINYWWGMDSGAIQVAMTQRVPDGVRTLADTMLRQLAAGTLDIFRRPIISQNGQRINDGERSLDAGEILRMDWLCSHVEGRLPDYEELLPISRALVRELGVYRDRIPPEPESVP